MGDKLLYLDIDGVLLGKQHPDDAEIVLANHAEEFLRYCLNNFTCYWLTTHCRPSSEHSVLEAFSGYADGAVFELLKKIKTSSWNMLKTEAIDFSSDFHWIDDQPIYSEIEVLRRHNALDRWIQIDTEANPDDLKRAIAILKDRNSSVRGADKRGGYER